ncbi:hypothetical protein KZ483_05670 [Paenibacillus sp. sptzw28]|uniref:hypothetical protein n=1 Tax=Paenibacillus sp. sptzw28 TaxID=715179 RepID=UPI001C6E099F|nr:hypothetical protein [Paenibacillus sp. sptzw28]QYR22464.1 hypothetical protein KZ483_05670 [Paenibacillus sp. sptzw28]
MSKTAKVVLLAVLLIAACLCPFQQHAAVEQGNTMQLSWVKNTYPTAEFEPAAFKNGQTSLLFIPVIIFIMFLFIAVPPLGRLKFSIRSFIPILKLFYILNPVKFKSKFIALIPVHL